MNKPRVMGYCAPILFFAATISTVNADILDAWHWRNPPPFANSLRSSCFGSGKFVAVGDGGIIHTSLDGLSWDDGRRPVTSALRKIIFDGAQFIAVGHDGVIITSPDGCSWSSQSSGSTNALYSIAYGNGQFVACGAGGQLAISTNSSTWTSANVGTSDLNWITFGNGLFVIAAPNVSAGQTAVRTSPDAQSWATQALPAGPATARPSVLYEATFANGQFVAAANVQATLTPAPYIDFFTSTNGSNWLTGSFSPSSYDPAYWLHHFLTFANGTLYELLGEIPGYDAYQMLYTADASEGSQVSVATLPDKADATSLSYGNGRYLLTALNGKLWTSTTGTDWTEAYPGAFRTNIGRIIHGADKYLAAPSGGPILASSDGLNFTALPGSPSLVYTDIAFDGSNYVAVAEGGNLYTSNDGASWIQRASNTGENLTAVCRSSSRWAVVGGNGTIITSPNTLAWTLRFSGTGNSLNGVAYGNGIYVAVGEGGAIVTSPDTITWDAQYSGTTAALKGVALINGQFLVVGAGGTILTSSDGASWQSQISSTSRTLRGIVFGDGRLVACGFDRVISNLPDPLAPGYAYVASMNAIVQSTNGLNWEDITTKVPASVGLNAVAFLDGSFWLGGETGAILQSDNVDGLPRLAGSLLPDANLFQLKVTLNVPSSYRIQATTNLASSAWNDVVTITNPAPPYTWIDSNSSIYPRRFFRVAP